MILIKYLTLLVTPHNENLKSFVTFSFFHFLGANILTPRFGALPRRTPRHFPCSVMWRYSDWHWLYHFWRLYHLSPWNGKVPKFFLYVYYIKILLLFILKIIKWNHFEKWILIELIWLKWISMLWIHKIFW